MIKKTLYGVAFICLLLATISACDAIDQKGQAVVKDSSRLIPRVVPIPIDPFRALLPAYIKDPFYLPAGYSFSAEKATLGRYFFYDRRMSVNQTKSCASCHAPAFSFTDGYRRSSGALGDNVQRNAPALVNIVFNRYLTAADSSLHFPEQQINNPMFHNHPVELGWKGNESRILERLKKDGHYSTQMRRLFPADAEPFDIKNIQECIAGFVKTILCFNSPYDRYSRGKDSAALSAAELRGMKLFFSPALHCNSCHGGINFSTPRVKDQYGNPAYYQNTGLYNINGQGAYPASDCGLYEYTKQWTDMGKYRIPTLRNLAFTAPYLHDGTVADLATVIDIYKSGGRRINAGADRGDGRKNPHKSPLIHGFALEENQKKDLVRFLLCLSDSSVCNSRLFSNPFTGDETRQ